MQIVCGTDFSKNAAQAAETAAAFASRLHEPLTLVHVADEATRTQLPTEIRDSLSTFSQQCLTDEGQRLQKDGVEVHEAFREGAPDVVLINFAAEPATRLVVLSSLGRGAPSPGWILGSVVEHVAQTSPVPTLIVRSAEPFKAWAARKRSLRVFVGADFSVPSDAALRWVGWLRQLGPCDVTVANLDQGLIEPGSEAELSPTASRMLAKTEAVQVRCFRERVRELLGPKRVHVRIEKGWGRSDAHLLQLAAEERADLIVVGTHQHQGAGRFGSPSTSRGVLHYAPMSVACIPAGKGPPEVCELKIAS
jgi:nucleotide-binding universal stress UspA family protein